MLKLCYNTHNTVSTATPSLSYGKFNFLAGNETGTMNYELYEILNGKDKGSEQVLVYTFSYSNTVQFPFRLIWFNYTVLRQCNQTECNYSYLEYNISFFL